MRGWSSVAVGLALTMATMVAAGAACRRPPAVTVDRSVAVDAGAWQELSPQTSLATDFFLVPKSQEGLDAYLELERQDRPVRLIVVESAMNVEASTQDLGQAISRAEDHIDAVEPGLRELLDQHDRLLFTVVKTPLWLSSSSDTSSLPVDPGWVQAHAAPPRDLDTWAALVKATVAHLHDTLGDQAELQFEIWNEPDLYWTGTQEELLELYAVTARAIREVDPDAVVGGFGSNQWDGQVDGGEGPVLDALLERAARDDLPLDFVSVHTFVDHPDSLDAALDGVQASLSAHERSDLPVWITEWNTTSAYRGTAYQPAAFAAISDRFRARGVHTRFAATWQDYESHSDLGGYGLLTHQVQDKPVARVFRQQLALEGRQVQPVADGPVQGWVAQDGDCRLALLWRHLPAPELEALSVIAASLTTEQLAEHYTDVQVLLDDIRQERPPDPDWAELFAQARDALVAREAELTTVARVGLDLGVSGTVEQAQRLDTRQVTELDVTTSEGLTVSLEANAVAWLRVCP